MKTILTALLLLAQVSNATPNGVMSFACKTDKVIEGTEPTQIIFQVENMGQKNVNYYTEDPDSWEPVRMIPEDSSLMLNENWVIRHNKDFSRLKMESDGDGCQWTEFVLYKDSGYQRGWVRIADTGCGANPAYSTVTCTVK